MTQIKLVFLIFAILNLNKIYGSDVSQRKISWNTFRSRWGPDPKTEDGKSFIRQPRTIDDAVKQNYEKLPNGLGDICNGRTTVGHRYWKANDSNVILIYDRAGIISGLQLAFATSQIRSDHYAFDKQKFYNRERINGVDMYTLTVYFVAPETICTTGRNLGKLNQEGTGTGLYFQNGTNPLRDVATVPLFENQVSSTKWKQGACFRTMGNHYWYDNRMDIDCTQFLPAFLLYNKGELTGFGWAIVARLNFSPLIEYPPKEALFSFLKPVPPCLVKTYDELGAFTTMHLYFNTDDGNLDC